MTQSQSEISYRIDRRAGQKGSRAGVSVLAPDFEKYATERNKIRLLKCKNPFKISTFNVRTLQPINQMAELTATAINNQIDIICVQEHRLYHDEINLKYHELGKGWTFISASAVKNTANATIGGVGFLLSPHAMRSLNSIEKITSRIIVATFNGNPVPSIISCYSPTNTTVEQEVIDYYDELSSLVRNTPKHNILIIGGDLNAQLGTSKNHKFTYHQTSNRNGEHLENFLIENNLLTANTHFQKRKGKLWTFTYPNGNKAQLDYIAINKKWANSVKNCEAYHSKEGISSDHRIITLKISLTLRANKKRTNDKAKFNWKPLVENTDLQNQFSITLRNRYNALQMDYDSENINVNDGYQNFIKAHDETAEILLPKKEKVKAKLPWENDVIMEKRKELSHLAQIKNKHCTRHNTKIHKQAQKELEAAYLNEQQKYIQTQIDKITNASENKQSSLAWQTVNEITGRKKATKAKIKANSQNERLNKWKSHFQNLLGKQPNVSNKPIEMNPAQQELDIKTGPFNENELELVLKKLKNKKAAGLDNIPPEVWKTGKFNDLLLYFCNEVYKGNTIQAWTEGCILPFPKKGDLSQTSNYRGITLTSIAAKVYNGLLLHRIQPEIEKILRRNQNGFRRSRSTVSQILTIRRIIEGVKARQLPATLLFVDFSKAFDSIHRTKMEKILLAYGIPKETVAAIMILYKNTKALVRSPDGDTEFFEILAGVLQGDTLAPFLFVICLDYVLKNSVDQHREYGLTLSPARSRRHPAKKITDADYADDLALLSDNNVNAQKLLHLLEETAAIIGLHTNAVKTEYMCYHQVDNPIETLNRIDLKKVNDFVYLGSNIASTEKDVLIRMSKAWSALDRLKVIWKSTLSEQIKKNFFRAVVESVLLYGSTSWTLTKKLQSKLDGTYTRMLRAILNIHWSTHPTIAQLYGNLPRISATLKERRTKFAGHCYRSTEEVVSDLILWTPRHGTSKTGRPYKTYIKQLMEDTDCHLEDLPKVMKDRELWRDRVNMVRATRPIR